jgi:hypothetical protein
VPAWRDHARLAERVLAQPAVLPATLALLTCLAYGNEIFNNHLTIDEEYFADSPMWRAWLGDGRWGMAALSGLLVPRAVGPVVSTTIGVLGFAAALLIYVRTLTSSRSAALLAAAFGVVFPVLPFLVSFSTLSYGTGVAAVCTAAAFRLLVKDAGLRRLAWVVLLWTFAIAVYQTFLFALPLMLLLYLAGRALREPLLRRWTALLLGLTAACAVASVAAYIVVFQVLKAVTGVQTAPYVAGQLDLAGLLADPVTRLRVSFSFVVDVLSADPVVYRGDARVVGPALLLSGLALVAVAARRQGVVQGTLVALLGLVCGVVLVVLEATTPYESALRSLVYMPFVAAGTVALGLEALHLVDRRRWAVAGLAALVATAAVGLTSDMNRLFLSTEILYERDAALAEEFDRRLAQVIADSGQQPTYLALVGARTHVEGPLTPKRETLGTSFFEWDGGNPGRAAVFIRLVTGRELASAPPDVAGWAAAQAMDLPAWPVQGSVALRMEGDVAVLKLAEPTPDQELLWCGAGVTPFCEQ